MLSCGRSAPTASFSDVRCIDPLTHLILVHSIKYPTNQTVISVLSPSPTSQHSWKSLSLIKKNPNVFIALYWKGTCWVELMSRGNRFVPFSTRFVCHIIRIVCLFFVVVDVVVVGLYFIARSTITAN